MPKKFFCRCDFLNCKRRDRGFTRFDELKRHYDSHLRKLEQKIKGCKSEKELEKLQRSKEKLDGLIAAGRDHPNVASGK